MDYLKLKTSNKLLKEGKMPEMKSFADKVVAGFGKFDEVKREFEYPINFEKTQSDNIIFNEWSVDNTSVVYESLSSNGEKQVIHCNLTELEFKIKPLSKLFCINKIKEKLSENQVFHFIDEDSKRRFFVSLKEDYKSFYG